MKLKARRLLLLICLLILPVVYGQTHKAKETAMSTQQEKLKALEQAFKAGIISEQEYEAKKKDLAAAPANGAEQQRKLKALEDARKVGIISEQEYQAKKEALNSAQTTSSTKKGSANFGLKVEVLSEAEYQMAMQQLGRRMGVRVTAVEANSVAARAGVQANDIVLMVGSTPVSTPDEFYSALRSAGASPVLQGVRVLPNGQLQTGQVVLSSEAAGGSGASGAQGQNSALAQALIGTWEYHHSAKTGKAYVSRTCTFYPNGTYEYISSVSVYVDSPKATAGSADRADRDQGTWELRGNTLTGRSSLTGQTMTMQLQMAKPGALYVNGELWLKR